MGSTAVIIAALNGERHLAAALDSIAAQTQSPCELIVVDDGSSDGTIELLRDRGIEPLTPGHAGAPAARNAGRKACRTDPDFLLFLDQDDVLCEPMIERLSGWLDEHAEAGMVSCAFDVIDDDGNRSPKQLFFPPRRAPDRVGRPRVLADTERRTPLMAILDLTAVLPSTTLVRRTVFDTIGGWDETLVGGGVADTALAVEVALVAEVHFCPERLVRYRVHPSQESAARDRLRAVQDAYLARLRERGEPELCRAWRDYDRQIVLSGSSRAIGEALRVGRFGRAGRIAVGAVRCLIGSSRFRITVR